MLKQGEEWNKVAATEHAAVREKFLARYKLMYGPSGSAKVLAQKWPDSARNRRIAGAFVQELLQTYLEVQKGERKGKGLQGQIDHSKQEMEYLRGRTRELAEENDKLRELNLKYHADKRADMHTNRNLQSEIDGLKVTIRNLEGKLRGAGVLGAGEELGEVVRRFLD